MEVDIPAENGTGPIPDLSVGDRIKTPHNVRLYQQNQKVAQLVNELVEYQLANPERKNPTSRADIDYEKRVDQEIIKRKKAIRAQMGVIKTQYRQSVMKVREEKAMTSESRNVNDALILQLHNLKYEESSLRSEISAAETYE
jgi:THO complex subunit 5